MKSQHIVLLVLAAAVAGGGVATFVQRSRQAAVPQQTAQTAVSPAPIAAAPEPVATPAPEPAAKPEPAKPSALPKSKPAPAAKPAPVAVAANTPPPSPAPAASTPARPPAEPVTAPRPVEPEPEPVAPAPPPPPATVTLDAGTMIYVRLIDGLSSERNNAGDTFTASIDKELTAGGFVIAERGARVEGRVVSADRAGKVRGVAALSIALTRIHTSDGQVVNVETDSFARRAEATQKQDAAKVGAGAAIGAIIGAIAGGGKGAAIGAGVGGGAGAGDVLLTRGQPATLPSETRLTFRLSAPVTITERK